MQTTGAGISAETLARLFDAGVTMFSLSVSSFDENRNAAIIHAPVPIPLRALTKDIKDRGINLRLSLNLCDGFADVLPQDFFAKASALGADQVTFRELYSSGGDTEKDRWIRTHKLEGMAQEIAAYVKRYGAPLELLPFGFQKYDVGGLGTVVDTDCMAKTVTADYKYLILREDCKLYSRWDTKASLIF